MPLKTARCSSAVPDGSKPLEINGNVKGYKTSGALERFFCEACGTSLYEDAAGLNPGLIFLDTGALATGEVEAEGKKIPVFQLKEHIFVGDTKDGGLRDWTKDVSAWEGWMNKEVPKGQFYGSTRANPKSRFVDSRDELRCACKCGGVEFNISRPAHGSTHWPAPSELEMAASPVSMPRSPEWWMPAEGAKFNAYLCACNDCRFASGYELTAWAIIPRKNFRASDREPVSPDNVDSLHQKSTVRYYESSPGCHRQFCGRCGATISFFTEKMPNTMNVSVGLMQGKSGPRVDEWLEWQTDEIGYAALAQNKSFVNNVMEGMKMWAADRAREA